MEKLKFEELRIRCKVLMIFAGLDKRGGQKQLSTALGIDSQSLNHALCGARKTEPYYNYLMDVYNHLESYWENLSILKAD